MENLAISYTHFHPDSTFYFGRQIWLTALRLKDYNGEADGLRIMSIGVRQMGNYPKALEYALQGLKISEQKNQFYDIYNALSAINTIYYFQKDGKNTIAYASRALNMNIGTKDMRVLVDCYQGLAEGYEVMNMKDSSLFYDIKAYQEALKMHDEEIIAFCQENMADSYFALGQDSMALLNYRLAIPYFAAHHVDEGTCESAQYLARIFERKNKPDSAIWYGQLSLRVAQSSLLTSRQSDASNFLAAFYKKRHQPDSALKYLEFSGALKDSLFNKEKVQEMENLTFDENNRQQELQDEKKRDKEASVRNLQLIAIAIFIPVFFLFVLFLGRIKVKARLVEFLAIVDLLLFFEFITDLVYPYISDFTNDRPVWEMLILVLIASLLEPLNFTIEHWIKKHLVEKPMGEASMVVRGSGDSEI
jgi:tetratricopeptide (TPR) repeat protein